MGLKVSLCNNCEVIHPHPGGPPCNWRCRLSLLPHGAAHRRSPARQSVLVHPGPGDLPGPQQQSAEGGERGKREKGKRRDDSSAETDESADAKKKKVKRDKRRLVSARFREAREREALGKGRGGRSGVRTKAGRSLTGFRGLV